MVKLLAEGHTANIRKIQRMELQCVALQSLLALNDNSIFPHVTEAIEQNLKGKQTHAYLLAKILPRPP